MNIGTAYLSKNAVTTNCRLRESLKCKTTTPRLSRGTSRRCRKRVKTAVFAVWDFIESAISGVSV